MKIWTCMPLAAIDPTAAYDQVCAEWCRKICEEKRKCIGILQRGTIYYKKLGEQDEVAARDFRLCREVEVTYAEVPTKLEVKGG